MDKEKMKEFGAVMAGGPIGYMAYKNKDKIKEKGKVIISAAKKFDKKFKSNAKQASGEWKKTGEGMKKAGVAVADSINRIVNAHTPHGVLASGVGLIKDKLAERKSNKMRAEVNEKAAESLGRKTKYSIDHIVPLSAGGSNNAANLRVLPKILKK